MKEMLKNVNKNPEPSLASHFEDVRPYVSTFRGLLRSIIINLFLA
jgi:hypothetical protein